MSDSTKMNKAIVKFKQTVPIVSWLPQYTKFDGVSDLISGITVGLTIMPQSMAYAALANLPPHYGLYSSFMGAFMYVMFGTIKEASIGPTSLMALLTLSYTNGLPIEFVILLSFLGGWVQLFMGIFKLGFLVDFISTPAISGFTSATSFTIVLAQLKGLFGIRFTSDNVFHYIQKFYLKLPKIRYYDLILGCCSIVILLVFKNFNNIKCNNPVVKKTLWFLSIGRNALIVLLCSILAYCLEYKFGKSPFTLYGTVPAGIPSMQLPQFSSQIGNQTVTFVEMVQKLGTGIVVIPVVSVLSNVAVAKAFTSGKRVDSAQEMVTLGICNIMGSFVQSMPVCGAFTRSAVANASGVRTPLAGIYAGTIILLALSFLTPYFYYIPKSTLAAVLISAVIFMIDIKIIPKLWYRNKYDLFVLLLTFSVSIIFSVEHGLLVGVIVNLIPMIKLWTRPKIDFAISTTREGQTYLLVKPELGLYYSASEYFAVEATKTISSIEFGVPVVFDFKNILYIDYTSAQSLTYLLAELQKDDRLFLFMNLSESCHSTLSDLISEYGIKCCENDDDIFESLMGVSIAIEDSVETKLLPPK